MLLAKVSKCTAARYGNLQMFPRPTADPAVARTNPKRLENPLLSLLIILSTFFHIYSDT